MQGLMVVGLIVEEILNVDVKCVKGTGAQNRSNLSYRPPVLSNHLPLKATISDPIKGKEVELYLY